MRLHRFNHIKHFNRFKEVSNILVKHGFGFIFDRIDLRGRIGFEQRKKDQTEIPLGSIPRRLRYAIEELGPTYIKLGQLLSTRPDVLGPEYIAELEKLQNEVPPIPYEQVLNSLVEEGINIERDFEYFNPEPIAAASIAQVHEACLKNGDRVVVKVQRPGIEEIIRVDLEIISEFSRLLEKRTDWGKLYRIGDVADELAQAITRELDFNQEARNAHIFWNNFAGSNNIKIPRVYWDYSSRKVITLEYVGGVKISNFSGLKQADYSTEKICLNLVDILFKQVFVHGFFHADPHPGNIAVTTGNTIILYDFGQVGVVDEMLKRNCMDMLVGMMRYDVAGVTRSLLKLGVGTQYINQTELQQDISRLQQKYYGMPLSEIKIGEALGELVQLSTNYQIRVPPELSLMVKMFMTVESMISQLDPTLSIIDVAEPYGRKVLMQRYSPEHVKEKVRNIAFDYANLIETAPRELENILNILKEGELRIKMEHSNINRLGSRIDIISNRLALAIIVASIIIGTALLVDKTGDNFIRQIPMVEVGFITTMILGLFLIYSIIRSGRY
ncbi:MAG: ABC1 kinase family protein [Syntrophomonadaceae bacterium]|jgi:ubiquinone biosynthesis protein